MKKKVLCWGDFVGTTTGFGVVCKNIMSAVYSTGLYEIDQLAINYFGNFYDKEEFPYVVVPARLRNPQDPYGNQAFLDAVVEKDYDIIFIVNDTFVVEGVVEKLKEVLKNKSNRGRKIPALIYYYPVDCKFLPTAKSMVELADFPIPYTKFAREETVRVLPKAKDFSIVYHGADIENLKPLHPDLCRKIRADFFNINDDNTFLWINVNRNSLRKDIARTILAFSEFRKIHPNTKLYLHTKMFDKVGGLGIDLRMPIDELGLSVKDDVIFPMNLNPASGVSIQVLNQIYNAADGFITTHLGEGFGLTVLDAMTVGVPVVAPNNTSMPELTNNGEWAYLYECEEKIYVENSGYRPLGTIKSIVSAMERCYSAKRTVQQIELRKKARAFCLTHSWSNIGQQWKKIFTLASQKQNSLVSIAEKI